MAGTVTVGCKLPNGLIINTPEGKQVTLNGANSSVIEGGYGLTENVDKDTFDWFVATYADAPFIKNELVFAQENSRSAKAKAKENEGLTTGLEGLDPEKPAPGIKKADDKE